jgi:hypothetical protein
VRPKMCVRTVPQWGVRTSFSTALSAHSADLGSPGSFPSAASPPGASSARSCGRPTCIGPASGPEQATEESGECKVTDNRERLPTKAVLRATEGRPEAGPRGSPRARGACFVRDGRAQRGNGTRRGGGGGVGTSLTACASSAVGTTFADGRCICGGHARCAGCLANTRVCRAGALIHSHV